MNTRTLTTVLIVMAAALLAPPARAQGGPGEPDAEPDAPTGRITVISTTGGPTMTSDDGGNTWRFADSETERNARRDIGRSLQAIATGTTISNTSVFADASTGTASIRFTTLQPGEIVLTMHDARGVEVARAQEGKRSEGTYVTTFETSNLTNGVYCFRIMNDGAIAGGGTLVIAH